MSDLGCRCNPRSARVDGGGPWRSSSPGSWWRACSPGAAQHSAPSPPEDEASVVESVCSAVGAARIGNSKAAVATFLNRSRDGLQPWPGSHPSAAAPLLESEPRSRRCSPATGKRAGGGAPWRACRCRCWSQVRHLAREWSDTRSVRGGNEVSLPSLEPKTGRPFQAWGDAETCGASPRRRIRAAYSLWRPGHGTRRSNRHLPLAREICDCSSQLPGRDEDMDPASGRIRL